MRLDRRALALLWVAAGVAAPSVPASAQSFFEKLFGLGAPQRPATAPPQARRFPLPSLDADLRRYERRRDADDDDADRESSNDGPGKVRTLCVRLCDGFYWPISDAISKRNLGRDARKCQASCGEDSALFYEPAPGGADAAQMLDFGGRPYSALPNAFLYRKTRVHGCSCKPEPWEHAELARHRRYADAATAGKTGQQAPAMMLAAAATPASPGRELAPNSVAPVVVVEASPAVLAAPASPLPNRVVDDAMSARPNRTLIEPSPPPASPGASPAETDESEPIVDAVRAPAPTPPSIGTIVTETARVKPAPSLVRPQPSAHERSYRPASRAAQDLRETRRSPSRVVQPERQRPRQGVAAKAAAPAWALGMQPKFTYPGDPPPRVR